MTKKETKKAAKNKIFEGKTKQETFEELKNVSQLQGEALAKVISSIATPQIRQKYRSINSILIVIIIITIISKVIIGIPMVMQNGIKWLPILFILPMVNILLLWGVATFRSWSYLSIAILSIIAIWRSLADIFTKLSDPWVLLDLIIAIGLISLALFLNNKLFPEYKVEKERYINSQGHARARNVIKFDD